MLQFLFFFCITIILLSTASPLGTIQSAAVCGNVFCHGLPAAGVLVRLYDIDRFDKDDLMGETTSDAFGHFQVSGHEKEISNIDPQVFFYHQCGLKYQVCSRKFGYLVPQNFVSFGKVAQNTYSVGDIELSEAHEGEVNNCFD